MLRNYVKIALRAMLKNKVFTTLNVLGLTLGIVAALVIFLYVQDEFTYDQHHANTGRIHRLAVTYHLPKNAGQETWATIAAPVGGYVVQDYPEVEKAVRFRSASNKVVEKPGTNLNLFEKIWYTDSTVFSIFDFPLLQGNPAEALNDPFEMVITQEVARRYSGTEDALGRTLFLPEDSTTFTITGVLAPIPANSHLKFGMLASLPTIENFLSYKQSWWGFNSYTYLLLKPGANAAALEEKVRLSIDGGRSVTASAQRRPCQRANFDHV